jgi:hypothetical protein
VKASGALSRRHGEGGDGERTREGGRKNQACEIYSGRTSKYRELPILYLTHWPDGAGWHEESASSVERWSLFDPNEIVLYLDVKLWKEGPHWQSEVAGRRLLSAWFISVPGV